MLIAKAVLFGVITLIAKPDKPDFFAVAYIRTDTIHTCMVMQTEMAKIWDMKKTQCLNSSVVLEKPSDIKADGSLY